MNVDGVWWSDEQYQQIKRERDEYEEALQLCLMRFKECGVRGHDKVIHLIQQLLGR